MNKYLKNLTKISDIYKINYALAGFYLAQLVAIILVSRSHTLLVSTNYITRDQLLSKAYGNNVLSPASSRLFDVNLKVLIIILLGISVLVYVWLATRNRYQYERNLRRQINPVRWIQTGVSNGLILILVGLLAGITDLATLIIIFVLPIVANLLLLMKEKLIKLSAVKSSLWLTISLSLAFIPLATITWYVISADIYGVKGIAIYIYFLLATAFLLNIATFTNQILQSKKYKAWKKFIYVEQLYIAIEVVIKTAIIWQVFAGVLH